ncbi:MAG: hypothetical protein ACK4FG_03715 [Brevundimonas sp.]
MQDHGMATMATEEPASTSTSGNPIREYICALATELAHMARTDGDENLGAVLDVAASLAQRPA